ncbi:MAG: cytochrome c3 family protein [Desulfatiglandales bacterium]
MFFSGSLIAIVVFSCSAPSRQIIAPPAFIKGAEPVGMETCAQCHEDRARNFEHTAHGRYFISREEGEEVMSCESCHGQGSLHLEVGGGMGQYIINPSENPESCYQCHTQIQVAFNLEYHHPVREERLTCTGCHDPHGDIYLARGMRMGREDAVCSQCHEEHTRPRVFVHEALREGCTVCHRAHGSINDKLLVENDNNLCLKCHAQLSMPGSMVIGDFPHTTRLAEGTCWSAGCHTAVHGSDINPHLRY